MSLSPQATPRYAPERDQPLLRQPRFWLLSGYVVAFAVAELMAARVAPMTGLWLHTGLLSALFIHSVSADKERESELFLAMAVLPLIRILSLAMPLWVAEQVFWFPMVNIPLIIGTVIAAQQLRYTRYQLGLRLPSLKEIPLQVLIASSGFLIGFLERQIIQPVSLSASLTPTDIIVPAISLMLFTGLSEELLFRGVLQNAAIKALSPLWGILYAAAIFGILHMGWQSYLDVAYVSVVGAFWGWVVYKTKSIFGVTIAHGIANIMLFLVLPHLS